jgi:hypothetical protein
MFRLSLSPANPAQVKTWLVVAGLASGGPGILSIGLLVKAIRQAIPDNYILTRFVIMALAAAIITALPLAVFKKVISVSFAQLGSATSVVYLGFSLSGAFQADYRGVITAILLLMDVVLLVLFSSGLSFLNREGERSDVFLGLFMLIVFLGVWLYPILVIWR